MIFILKLCHCYAYVTPSIGHCEHPLRVKLHRFFFCYMLQILMLVDGENICIRSIAHVLPKCHIRWFSFSNFNLAILFSVYISFNFPYQACFEFWEELNDHLVNWGWKLKLKEQGPYLTKKNFSLPNLKYIRIVSKLQSN